MAKGDKTLRLGVIGLGAMGRGMALSALSAGFEAYGHDLSETARMTYLDLCQKAGRIPQLGHDADLAAHEVVFTVMVDAPQTEAFLFGPKGAAFALPAGAVVVMCSTIAPAISADFARRLAAHDILYLDAPVSGGWQRAETGDLTFICAGGAEAYERALPALRAMGRDIFYMGADAGAGNRVKLVNQLMVSAHLVVTAEAMTLAASAGIDLEAFAQVITTSAGSSRIFEMRSPDLLRGDFTAHAALDLMVKDVALVLEEARALALELPITQAVQERFRMAQQQGHGRASTTAVIKTYSEINWEARATTPA